MGVGPLWGYLELSSGAELLGRHKDRPLVACLIADYEGRVLVGSHWYNGAGRVLGGDHAWVGGHFDMVLELHAWLPASPPGNPLPH